MRSLAALPKAHLHLHLEGSARPATVEQLAARAGVELDDLQSYSSLSEFVERYRIAVDAITEPADLERVCYELILDEAAQGVLWTEPMVAPQFYEPAFGSIDDVWATMKTGFERGAAETGVRWGVLVGHVRTEPVALAETMATWAAEHAGDGVVGFGIAGDERLVGPQRFGRAFDIAAEAGLLLVPHAGETVGPEGIHAALSLGADRLAHGVRAVEDPDLLRRLATLGVTCDVSPTSNLRLSVYESIEQHPLPQLLQAGVPVSLNSDAQLFFESQVTDEYELARSAFGLSDDDLASIARTSSWASGAPPMVKARMEAAIDGWLAG